MREPFFGIRQIMTGVYKLPIKNRNGWLTET